MENVCGYSLVETLTEEENPAKVNCILYKSCLKKRRGKKERQQQKRQFMIYF